MRRLLEKLVDLCDRIDSCQKQIETIEGSIRMFAYWNFKESVAKWESKLKIRHRMLGILKSEFNELAKEVKL